MNQEFIKNRISTLRIKKGVSEYQMSLDLGHSRGYIQNISSGKSMPSMEGFLEICDYFEITPAQFFDNDIKYPDLIQKTCTEMQKLNDTDLRLLLNIIKRFQNENS
ncbi:MAG: helix-turn-helix transcriptional regulator [Firmicutes bacterium]|nr:helix-turn-helix transcriptional regulator [Bacillota bacterium]